MTIRYVADRGVRNSTSTGTATVTLTDPTNIKVGSYLIARVAVDNSGTSGALPGLAVTDSRSLTWTVGAGALQDPGVASAGVAAYLCYVLVSKPYLASDTVVFTWTTGTPISAIVIEEWQGIDLRTPAAVAQVTANNVSTTAQPAISRTPTASGQLMYVVCAAEQLGSEWAAQDTDTTAGSWVDVTKAAGNTGTHDTSMAVYGGYKLVTGTSAQTWNNTLGATGDWAAVAIVFAVGVQAPLWVATGATTSEDPPIAAGFHATGERLVGTSVVNATPTPTAVAAIAAIGTPGLSSTVAPTAVAAIAAISTPGLRTTAAPTAVAAIAAVATQTPTATATFSPTAVAAVAAVATQSPTASSTTSPTAVAAIAAVATQTPVLPGSALWTATGTTVSEDPPIAAGFKPPASRILAVAVVNATVSPTAVAGIGAVGTPTITASATVSPTAVAAVAAVATQTPRASSTISPAAVAAIAAVGTPTFTATATISPTAVAAVAIIATQSPAGPTSITPTGPLAVAAVAAQSPRASSTISPTAVTAVVAVGVPSFNKTVQPAAVAAVAAITSAPVTVTGVAAPVAVTAVAAIGTPPVSATCLIHPTASAAFTAIGTPTITFITVASPAQLLALVVMTAPTITTTAGTVGGFAYLHRYEQGATLVLES